MCFVFKKMKIKGLNKILLIVAVVFAFKCSVDGQTSDTGPSIWLNGGVGSCFADAYDSGAAPMSLFGVGTGLQSGVILESGRYSFQWQSRYRLGLLATPLHGYIVGMSKGAEFLYCIRDKKSHRFHIWVGGGIHGEGSLKVLPSMKTCAVSSSIYANLSAEGMLQYDFAFIQDDSHNLLTAYVKLRLPLVGVVNYPGFSYMDNYVSNINLLNTLLSTYETRGIFCPGASTDVGLRFNLPNGNRIGLSYHWDYLTTRNRGYYRFDNAFHSVTFDFMFKLN